MMKKKVTCWFLCFLIVLLVGSAYGEVDNRIVAIVNNDIITYYELEKGLKGLNLPSQGGPNRAEIQKQLLFQMIDHKLVDMQVKKMGLQVLAEEVDKAVDRIKQEQGLTTPEAYKDALARQGLTEKEFKDKIKDQILRYKLISREIGSKIIISQERVDDYYKKNKDEFQRTEGVHLAHIILRTGENASPEEVAAQKKKAQEIWERLKKGENFAELARTYSQDASAGQGGDLGVFKLTEIDSTLREAISQLKPGEISPVIESPQGLQIVKLIDRQEGKAFTVEEVKDRIQNQLYQAEMDQRFTQWLQQLKDRSYIQVLL
jgi:peptidyl-prolyl cis-trans isomerase SurA